VALIIKEVNRIAKEQNPYYFQKSLVVKDILNNFGGFRKQVSKNQRNKTIIKTLQWFVPNKTERVQHNQ
jgi:hypothetical protein